MTRRLVFVFAAALAVSCEPQRLPIDARTGPPDVGVRQSPRDAGLPADADRSVGECPMTFADGADVVPVILGTRWLPEPGEGPRARIMGGKKRILYTYADATASPPRVRCLPGAIELEWKDCLLRFVAASDGGLAPDVKALEAELAALEKHVLGPETPLRLENAAQTYDQLAETADATLLPMRTHALAVRKRLRLDWSDLLTVEQKDLEAIRRATVPFHVVNLAMIGRTLGENIFWGGNAFCAVQADSETMRCYDPLRAVWGPKVKAPPERSYRRSYDSAAALSLDLRPPPFVVAGRSFTIGLEPIGYLPRGEKQYFALEESGTSHSWPLKRVIPDVWGTCKPDVPNQYDLHRGNETIPNKKFLEEVGSDPLAHEGRGSCLEEVLCDSIGNYLVVMVYRYDVWTTKGISREFTHAGSEEHQLWLGKIETLHQRP